MNCQKRDTLSSIKGWTIPQLHFGKSTYVSFSAFNPVTGGMKRKKIMLDHIKKKVDRRKYADYLIKKLIEKLVGGWNPWVDDTQPMQYTLLNDVFERYRDFIMRQFET